MVRSTHGDEVTYPELSGRIRELLHDTRDRRISLPPNPNDRAAVDDAETPWDIENVEQLQHWADADPSTFLKVLDQCRKG